jgi:hypothetical protein
VQKKIRAALDALRSEIDTNINKGNPPYPRRLSQSEVLRRAGGIDKNTLKQPYHSDLRAEVERFLDEVRRELPSKKSKNRSRVGGLNNLDYYAQMLVAAQVLRDDAVRKRKELEAELSLLKDRVAVLEREYERLRQAGSNVVSIVGGKS